MAVQQLLRRIDDEAIVLNAPAGVDARAHADAWTELRLDAAAEEVRTLRPLAEIFLTPDDVLNLVELRQRDVVQAADLIAAAVGQPRIQRCGDAVRTVVVWRHEQVV